MIAMSKILLPVDFSKFSLYALKYAVSLAKEFKAKLYVMHVVDVYLHDPAYFTPFISDRPVKEDYAEKARSHIDENILPQVPRGIETEVVVRDGKPFVEIVRFAREEAVDLIVIATHGRTGLSHAMMGSVAEKVVRKAPCPVLSVRHPEHDFVMP